METSLKTGFAQIFSRCPKNLSCPKFGGAAAPLAPLPGPYAYEFAVTSGLVKVADIDKSLTIRRFSSCANTRGIFGNLRINQVKPKLNLLLK